ncbi:hypothetical protein B0A48_11142 [Cryoendolithus antarcticus]|uniref:UDENN domain-containing protein n=1 Tax=Cryoendolithus antarcticus TaxID=1507870 RepID=A0A1V8SUW1_9PEZI|nr:hypothetical protein B0A48_11142 [Cryoendolithus antarcticus]
MAPSHGKPRPTSTMPNGNTGDTSAPLADYFFICGVESSQIFDEKLALALPTPPVEDTIEEDRALEIDNAPRPTTPGSPVSDAAKRRSRYSFEARKSIGSIIGAAEGKNTGSNRSSATIKPTGNAVGGSGLSDDAFEEALKKFASERDSFLDDINISAGVVQATAPTTQQRERRVRPRTVRIAQEEGTNGAGLKSSVGSLRRKLSTMNNKRQTIGNPSRASTVRTSKRVSGYNSVMPSPEPFQIAPDMHPLKRQYEPVLLDRYPTSTMVDESKRRSPFPEYVPMFAFPNDVTVVSSDEKPRSTWHGFALTGGDNAKMYGICVVIWTPLNAAASGELERQCEVWRRGNMSQEERELASSLGERLSGERAKLSRLLAELPSVASGSDAREALEEKISAVEEKIGLMTDLLRPVRHGAASKIDGLTEGDTGFWIPRAYGILGRDGGMTSFWKEWLKAVVVPMTNSVLRVPPSSPKVGIWQPLERYVVNLCVEALSPITSITQVELAIRDLRLYARKEAINEIPGSRNTDLYALFRCLTTPNIVTLLEYALVESRIIFLSSHTAMLHLAIQALTSLLYPLKWCGVLIPILPQRLIQVLEAPCPYIVGVERRYEKLQLPEGDFCLVDLDENTIESTIPPVCLPRPQRRKLMALLQAAAPHHNRYGVPTGPPAYAIETYPHDAFSSENPQVFSSQAAPSTLAAYVSESSTTFGEASPVPYSRTLVFNAFLQARNGASRGSDRPSTSSTNSMSSSNSPPSPVAPSPLSSTFSNGTSRNDSGFSLQATLREKRSGHFGDGLARRNSSFGLDRINTMRRPSQPAVVGHHPSHSTSTLGGAMMATPSSYAPSVYATSTLAASTIMPQQLIQPVRENESMKWVEGHCMVRRSKDGKSTCAVCDERCDDESFRCNGCTTTLHPRCLQSLSLPCPRAFHADQLRAAFVRCFASLFYTYRRHLSPASGDRKKSGLLYHFDMDGFLRSVPHGDGEYMAALRQTQMFNEFIAEREALPATSPEIKLFDEIILSKRNRGRTSLFSKSSTSFLSDTSDHLWRSAAATPPSGGRGDGNVGGGTGRCPTKLEEGYMKAPRSIQGAPPRVAPGTGGWTRRKPVGSMLVSVRSAGEG